MRTSRTRPAPRWMAPALLALAAAFAGDVGYSYVKTRSELAAKEAELARIAPRTYRAARAAPAEEVAAARETVQRLSSLKPGEHGFAPSVIETFALRSAQLIDFSPQRRDLVRLRTGTRSEEAAETEKQNGEGRGDDRGNS